MKKPVVLLLALLIVVSAALAQENMGARPISMGGAYAGLADDANAIFLNPAGIGYIKGESASVSSKISQDDEYTILGGVEGTPYGSFGIGYISASKPISTDDSLTLTDLGDASVKALTQTLVLSYARQLNDFMIVPKSMGRLSVGTNLKFVSSRLNNAKGLANEESSGFNLDLAAVFRPNDSLSYGFSIRNMLGNSGDLVADESESRARLTGGIAGKLFGEALILSLEGSNLGCELNLLPALALRLGRDGNYNTAGVGIELGGLGVDYAYLAKEQPVHYVAVSLAIDRPAGMLVASK